MALSVSAGGARRGSPIVGRAHRPGAAELANLSMPELNALTDLDAGLALLREQVARRRLGLYRDYVGATVSKVSPLLVRCCALRGLDLDRLAAELRPDQPWVGWLCGPRPLPSKRRLGVEEAVGPFDLKRSRFCDLQRFAFTGVLVGDPPAPDLGIRVLHDALEFACSIGGVRLRTFGIGGSVTVRGGLPAIAVSAAPGRPLDWLIGHPLVEGAGCTISEVRDETERGTEVLFRVPRVPWLMPWARSGAGGVTVL